MLLEIGVEVLVTPECSGDDAANESQVVFVVNVVFGDPEKS